MNKLNTNKQKYLIYTGNAYPHKNLSKLIDAVLVLKVNLKIVSGRSIFIERLEKEIEIKNAQEFVEIIGFVDDVTLSELYRNSIAFVFPSLAEGFGLPPMEAINAGTLAVVSDIPVLKEVYGESVFYFDPNDINSIKKSLDKVMAMEKEERAANINKSQELLKKYSWQNMAKETLKIYKTCI